jgi:peptide/nickel transport system substrate-binding protein
MTSITPICALRVSLTAAAFLTGAAFIDTASALSYVETPSLAADVAAGKLPPVAERLPDTPEMRPMNLVDQTIGRHGGSMTMLMARPKDIRLMVVYGYARLARYNRDMEIVPDILQNIDIEEGRKFTFHLRAGHKLGRCRQSGHVVAHRPARRATRQRQAAKSHDHRRDHNPI